MKDVCQFCGTQPILVTGQTIYKHRPDLFQKKFWYCPGCKAYVGCHPGTENSLGKLANKKTREARSMAHKTFDELWKTGTMSRGEAYAWLAEKLGLRKSQTHIGSFDEDMCYEVVRACIQLNSIEPPLPNR